MNSQQLIELMTNGEFDAILMCLNEVQTYVQTLSSAVTNMQSELNDTIHFPARLDPLTQTSIEKFNGVYFVGDQNNPTEIAGQTISASIQVGPTSEIILGYMPTKANQAIPKVYVDNLFRPINKALLAISTAMSKKVETAYYFNTGTNQATLQESDFQSGSSDHIDYLSVNPNATTNEVTFLQQGSYLILVYLTATVNSNSSNSFAINLNNKQIGQVGMNSGSAPLFLPISVNANDILTWQVSGSISDVSFGMSFIRLGDQ